MKLRALLIKIWQRRSFEIEEMLSLLEQANIDTHILAEILVSLSERQISTNEAEEEIKDAKRRGKVCC